MSDHEPGATSWLTVHRVVYPVGGVGGVDRLYLRSDGAYEVIDRTSVRVGAHAHVSLGTYFGAFPRVAWRSHAELDSMRLSLTVVGDIELRIRSTDAAGRTHTLQVEQMSGTRSFEISLDERSAGWLWFEAWTGGYPATVSGARWSVPDVSRRAVSVSVAVTTFNRADDCIALLRSLGSDGELVKKISRVVVVDQGTDLISRRPEFAETRDAWGELLQVVVQPNLGGSGGFSRGMLEARRTVATHVLVLDDDVVLEPESVLRMIALAENAADSPLIGAQMLDLTNPTKLYSWGERVDRRRFWWEPVRPELSGVDLTRVAPPDTSILSAEVPVDFNGWWMCLIPVPVINRLGAALPLFIKWDDAEYGLRAREAGFPTVTLPGAALWHLPWTGKDDGLDWQSYFQLRNRLVAALIHSPHRRGGSLIRDVLALDLNHVLCLQYGAGAVRGLAVRDVLSGPSHLEPTLRSGRARAAAVLAREGQSKREISIHGEAPQMDHSLPQGRWATARRFVEVVLHQLRRPRAVAAGTETVVPRERGKWWLLGLSDAVVLRSATGRGAFVLRRDRRRAGTLVVGAVGSAVALWWHWPRLAREYRAAAKSLASSERWDLTFSRDE